MSSNIKEAVINSLKPEKVSFNNKGDFWQIRNDYLCLGAKTTGKSKIPNKFEWGGWYRFFDAESVGEHTPLRGVFLSQDVRSDDEARLWATVNAVTEILVYPMEDLAYSVGALPVNLFIISAEASFIERIRKILDEPEDDFEFGHHQLYPSVKWHLRLRQSVYVCPVAESVVREISRWPNPVREWTTS
jgi:hypothetical protein